MEVKETISTTLNEHLSDNSAPAKQNTNAKETNQAVGLLDLPDELLVKIFSYNYPKGDHGHPLEWYLIHGGDSSSYYTARDGDPYPRILPPLLTCRRIYQIVCKMAYEDVQWLVQGGDVQKVSTAMERILPARKRYIRFIRGDSVQVTAFYDYLNTRPDSSSVSNAEI